MVISVWNVQSGTGGAEQARFFFFSCGRLSISGLASKYLHKNTVKQDKVEEIMDDWDSVSSTVSPQEDVTARFPGSPKRREARPSTSRRPISAALQRNIPFSYFLL